jgi:peptidyl-prolyl cis-trans isomerase D
MLDLMRKHARSWFIKILLFGVAVVFIFWGVGTFRERRASEVARVNGEPVTLAELEQSYQQILRVVQMQTGGKLDEKTLKEMKLKERALEGIIQERILVEAAKELKVMVTDEELNEHIQSLPYFQAGGRFSKDFYVKMLRRSHLTPEGFETGERRQMILNKTKALVAGLAKVSEEEAFQIFRQASQEVNLEVVRFQAQEYLSREDPSLTEQKAYFDKNKENYRTPVKASFYLMTVPLAREEAQVVVRDEEIAAFYKENTSRFNDPKKGTPKPLDAVKGEIVKQLKAKKSRDLALRKADELYETVLKEGGVIKANAKTQYPYQTFGPILQGEPKSDLEKDPQFEKTAFFLKKGDIGELVETAAGFYILQASDRWESRISPFEQVKTGVMENLKKEKARERALKEAAGTLAEWSKKPKAPISEIRPQLKAQETGFLTREKALNLIGFSKENLESVFSLTESSPLPAKPLVMGTDALLVKLRERRFPDRAAFQTKKDGMMAMLAQRRQEEVLSRFFEERKKGAKVEIHKNLL